VCGVKVLHGLRVCLSAFSGAKTLRMKVSVEEWLDLSILCCDKIVECWVVAAMKLGEKIIERRKENNCY
jgi:hypothetical protein